MTRARPTYLFAALLLAGCRDDINPYATPLDLLPPEATRDGLVYVDRAHDEAIFVLPDGVDLTVRRAPLGDDRSRAAWARATRDGASLLALTVPESAKEEDVDEQLVRFAADGAGEPVTYDVRAPFTSIALSPDHRRAVLFFG